MSFKKKDQEAIAKLVTEMYNEGFFDRFKKKPSNPDPDKPFNRYGPIPTPVKRVMSPSEEAYEKEPKKDVMVFGEPRKISERALMYDSELISKLRDSVELRLYESTHYQDPGRDSDFPIFIPVIVILNDDHDGYGRRKFDIIADVGKAHQDREEAIEELNKLAERHKPKLKQTHLNL